jgi:hypothetical protein
MQHKRAFIFGVVVKGCDFDMLKPNIKKQEDKGEGKKDELSLNDCFEAFEREEFLSGSD